MGQQSRSSWSLFSTVRRNRIKSRNRRSMQTKIHANCLRRPSIERLESRELLALTADPISTAVGSWVGDDPWEGSLRMRWLSEQRLLFRRIHAKTCASYVQKAPSHKL